MAQSTKDQFWKRFFFYKAVDHVDYGSWSWGFLRSEILLTRADHVDADSPTVQMILFL